MYFFYKVPPETSEEHESSSQDFIQFNDSKEHTEFDTTTNIIFRHNRFTFLS